MKTEKQIEEMANDSVAHLNSESYCTLEEYSFHENGLREGFEKGYTQAQKDILVEASEGFEGWYKSWSRAEFPSLCKEAWQASRLPLMKKIEELEKKNTKTQACNEYHHEEMSRLQKENEELREALGEITSSDFLEDHRLGFFKTTDTINKIRTKFSLDKNDKGEVWECQLCKSHLCYHGKKYKKKIIRNLDKSDKGAV